LNQAFQAQLGLKDLLILWIRLKAIKTRAKIDRSWPAAMIAWIAEQKPGYSYGTWCSSLHYFMERITIPWAIVTSEIGNITSVIYHDEAIDLWKQLRTLGAAPELKTIQATPYWLVLMPHPSSWYNDRFVAKIVVNNLKKPVDATLEKIKNARDRFGLRQSRFARALGFGGNDTTVKKLSSNGKRP
jgi:hypothetical protein